MQKSIGGMFLTSRKACRRGDKTFTALLRHTRQEWPGTVFRNEMHHVFPFLECDLFASVWESC